MLDEGETVDAGDEPVKEMDIAFMFNMMKEVNAGSMMFRIHNCVKMNDEDVVIIVARGKSADLMEEAYRVVDEEMEND